MRAHRVVGAIVTKIEPLEGDRALQIGPFPGDEPNSEASAPFLLFNTNKQSIVGDLETSGGIDLARRLARVSDVVVEGLAPGRLTELGLDLSASRRPRHLLDYAVWAGRPLCVAL